MTSGLKVTKDGTANLLRATKALVRSAVYVGVPESENARDDGPIGNAAIGYMNETGSPSQNIPARPHLIPGIGDAKEAIVKQFARAGRAALNGDNEGIMAGLTGAGLAGETAVKNKITSIVPPPLSENTLAARRSRGHSGTTPLLETGEYRRSITSVVRGA